MTGKLLAYHLKSPRVPLVVRVPQFENHCSRCTLRAMLTALRAHQVISNWS